MGGLGIWSWEDNGGGKGQGTRHNFFSVWAKCRPSHLFVCNKRRNGVQGQSPWSGNQGGVKPPWSWSTFSFWTFNESHNLIFGNAKSHRCLCCLEKMSFNKSHLCMCMVTRAFYHHQNFSWGSQGQGQGHRGGSCLLFSLWRRPCSAAECNYFLTN